MSVKLKNGELLELILDDLKTIRIDMTNLKQDISKLKNDVFIIKTIQEVKSDTTTKPPEPSSGWFF
jgi:hypothetical protein